METSSSKSILREDAVRTHPKSWIVMMYCITFTCGTAVFDLARVLFGWESYRGSQYFYASTTALALFVSARHRTRTNVPV
jgi:hypothetical protein